MALQQAVEGAHVVDPVGASGRVNRGVGDAVGHEDFGGKALEGLGAEVGLLQEPAIGVIVDIDKARGDDFALGVNAVL